MGLTVDRRIYVDTNALIAIVETGRPFPVIERMLADGTALFYTSELTLAEILVVPFRDGDDALVATYQTMASAPSFLTFVPLDRDVLTAAARIRAEKAVKLADAIHVATAAALGCRVVLSSDRRLHLPAGIDRIAVEDADKPELWPW